MIHAFMEENLVNPWQAVAAIGTVVASPSPITKRTSAIAAKW